jgi:CubicO group peptidase (beta-lactamase class C family)
MMWNTYIGLRIGGVVLSLLLSLIPLGQAVAQPTPPAIAAHSVMSNAVLANTIHTNAGPTSAVELAGFVDSLLFSQLKEEHVAGAAIAIVKDGELFFAKGYGHANVELQAPVVADQTIFGTGSTGKLFIWVAVMQLVEQGLLDLDTDVNQYLDFSIPATYPQPITLRHLMTHSAGFDNVPAMYAHQNTELQPLGTYLAAHVPVRIQAPGTSSAYSNSGAALAGYIVERVSGMPFDDYLSKHIFVPLDMRHTTFQQPLPAELAVNAATGYRYQNDTFQIVPPIYVRLPATGASHTTVTDMAHFMIALLEDGKYRDAQILSETTGQQIQQRLFSSDPRTNGMAYGLAEVTLNGQHILKHNGSYPASFNSILALLPEQHIGIYANYSSNGTFSHGEHFLQAFMNHYYPAITETTKPVANAAQLAAAMTGTYRATNAFHTTFAKLMVFVPGNFNDIQVIAHPDGSVSTRGLTEQPIEWVPIGADVLRRADGRLDSTGDLIFSRDSTGALTRFSIQNNPYRAYVRVPWYETAGFSVVLLGFCFLTFLSAIIVWPVSAMFYRRRTGLSAPQPVDRTIHWFAGAAVALYVLFLPGFVLTAIEALNFGPNPLFMAVLALPLIGSGLMLVSGVLLVRSGFNARWSQGDRIHYGMVVLASLAYIWLLNIWNIWGYRSF